MATQDEPEATKVEEEKEKEPVTSEAKPEPSPSPAIPQKEAEETENLPEKKKTKFYIIGLIFFILGVGATIVFLHFRAKQSVEEAQEKLAAIEEEEKKEVVEPSPSPTPLPREEISLEILNGSGVAGLAAETAATFEELGYEVIEVGNADEIEGNQLFVNPEIRDLLDKLLEDVEEELEIASIAGELTDSTASARIILGQ